jgi:hypothetical protein
MHNFLDRSPSYCNGLSPLLLRWQKHVDQFGAVSVIPLAAKHDVLGSGYGVSFEGKVNVHRTCCLPVLRFMVSNCPAMIGCVRGAPNPPKSAGSLSS